MLQGTSARLVAAVTLATSSSLRCQACSIELAGSFSRDSGAPWAADADVRTALHAEQATPAVHMTHRAGMVALARSRQLTHLTFGGCDDVELDAGVCDSRAVLAVHHLLVSLPNLQDLNVECLTDAPAAIEALATGWACTPALQRLKGRLPREVSLFGRAPECAPRLHHLTELTLDVPVARNGQSAEGLLKEVMQLVQLQRLALHFVDPRDWNGDEDLSPLLALSKLQDLQAKNADAREFWEGGGRTASHACA
jgi:hypothetical protein